MTDIKPCPYCGHGDAEPAVFTLPLTGPDNVVICHNCKACGPAMETEEQAINWWNKVAEKCLGRDKKPVSPAQIDGSDNSLNSVPIIEHYRKY